MRYRINTAGVMEAWRSELAVVPAFPAASIAIRGDTVYLASLSRDPRTTLIQQFDASGLQTISVTRMGHSRLVVAGDELYEIGGAAQIALLNPSTLDVRVSFGEAAFSESVLVRDDVLMLGSSRVVLERSTLRELPVTRASGEDISGFEHAVAGQGDVAFVSNGNAVIPFSLRCE